MRVSAVALALFLAACTVVVVRVEGDVTVTVPNNLSSGTLTGTLPRASPPPARREPR